MMKIAKILLVTLLIILNIILIPSHGTGDIENWVNIIRKIQTTPGSDLFPNCLNYDCGVFYPLTYPPGHFLVIYIFSKILPTNILEAFLTFKVTVFIFYLLTFISLVYFYKKTGATSPNKLSPIDLFLIYFISLSIMINTQGLGYTDVFYIPFLILSMSFIFSEKFFLGGIFFGLSFLIKWQPLIILPVIFIYLLKIKNSVFKFIIGIFISIAFLIPFNHEIITSLATSFFKGAAQDPILSSALNIQWLTTFLYKLFFPDIFSMPNNNLKYIDFNSLNKFRELLLIPKIIFSLFYWMIIIKYSKNLFKNKIKNKKIQVKNLLYTCFVSYFTYFFLSSSVHENHLFLALILIMLIYLMDLSLKSRIILIAFDILNLLNLYLFYGFTGTPPNNIFILPTSIIMAFISLLIFMNVLRSYFHGIGFFNPMDKTEEPKGKLINFSNLLSFFKIK